MTTIKIEKDEYLKYNECAFVPLIQNKEFDSAAAYYPLNFELMLA